MSLYALRVAVGMVSNVDLPLDGIMSALTMSASSEVLGAMGTSIPSPCMIESTPLPDDSTGVKVQRQGQGPHKEGYAALCRVMQRLETPPTSCCGLRFRCSSCGSTQRDDCGCVSWREEMVRLQNGRGGLVWVKRTNETAYRAKISREVELSRACPQA